MTHPGTLILPIAGRSSRFPGLRPKWMLTAPSGELMLELSIATVADWRERRLIIGALREHLDDAKGRTALEIAFGKQAEIVVFDEQTGGPAETVARMLKEKDVSGPIFIKDCDSWFVPEENVFDDCVCYADLQQLRDVRNVAAKSFVLLNESRIVTRIVEKSVTSNYISVGGYGFHEARIFLDAYDKLMRQPRSGEPFVSHVILQAMHDGAVFKGVQTEGYQDVGTLEAWTRFRSQRGVYFVDIDGVVLKNSGQYVPPLWDDADVPLPRNVEALKKLIARGAQLIFVTARPERYRQKTEAMLAGLGLTWHAAVFGVGHAGRTLINDYAGSNPYPSAVAINIVRNDDTLDQLLRLEG